jgi:hypothetical protein
MAGALEAEAARWAVISFACVKFCSIYPDRNGTGEAGEAVLSYELLVLTQSTALIFQRFRITQNLELKTQNFPVTQHSELRGPRHHQ